MCIKKVQNSVKLIQTSTSLLNCINNNNMNPSDLLVSAIDVQRQKEEAANIWKDSKYKYIAELESNNVGNVGENLIQKICENLGIESSIDGAKTKHKGGGTDGDGRIKGRSVEIKTARLGISMTSFQHELGEHPWKVSLLRLWILLPPTFICRCSRISLKSIIRADRSACHIFRVRPRPGERARVHSS